MPLLSDLARDRPLRAGGVQTVAWFSPFAQWPPAARVARERLQLSVLCSCRRERIRQYREALIAKDKRDVLAAGLWVLEDDAVSSRGIPESIVTPFGTEMGQDSAAAGQGAPGGAGTSSDMGAAPRDRESDR